MTDPRPAKRDAEWLRVLDDRGRERWVDLSAPQAEMTVKQDRAARRGVWLAGTGEKEMSARFGLLMGFLMMCAIALHQQIFGAAAPRWTWWITLIALLLPMMIGYFAWLSRRIRRVAEARWPLVSRTMLRARVCPVCRHPMGSALKEEHGLIQCSSCASAWRADRIGPVDDGPAAISEEGVIRKWLKTGPDTAAGVFHRDDAGSRVLVLCGAFSGGARSAMTRSEKLRLEVAADQAGAGRWAGVWGVLIVSVFAFFLSLGLIVDSSMGLLLKLAIVMLLTGFVAVITVLDRRSRPLRARRALLSESLCPSCAEDLSGSAPDSDGLVRCPLCAAAWRHADLGMSDRPAPGVVPA